MVDEVTIDLAGLREVMMMKWDGCPRSAMWYGGGYHGY